MQTLLLYASVVLIWGTTWAAIPYQLGDVPIPVSVGYRFLVAALVGLGFGIYPAVVASRQDPIVALRHD